ISNASVVYNAGRGDLACALAVEQVAGIDAVQQEAVAGIALAIGPDRLVAETAVYARAAGQFGVYSGRKYGESGEAAGGQRDFLNLLLVHHITVGGVDRVHER